MEKSGSKIFGDALAAIEALLPCDPREAAVLATAVCAARCIDAGMDDEDARAGLTAVLAALRRRGAGRRESRLHVLACDTVDGPVPDRVRALVRRCYAEPDGTVFVVSSSDNVHGVGEALAHGYIERVDTGWPWHVRITRKGRAFIEMMARAE